MKKTRIHNSSFEMKLDNETPFAVTEAYKTVRSNIIFTLAADEKKSFVVSSANEGEGKSTTSANLAITLAQTSAKVLLIDADLRKPTLHKIFQLENSHGLSRFLVGLEPLTEAVHTNVEPKLDLLTAGPTPPNPSELLGSKNMGILLDKMQEHYDYIVIDSPPINVVTDALVLSVKTAGVVMTVKYGDTTYDDVGRAVDAVRFANSNVLGVIFNNVDSFADGKYYYKGYKRYGRYGYRRYGYSRYGYSRYGYGRYGRSYAYQYGSTPSDKSGEAEKGTDAKSSAAPQDSSSESKNSFQRHPE